MAIEQPLNVIDMVNKLVRTSREMMRRIGREPTEVELGRELSIPVEKVRALWEIARTPVQLGT